MTGKGVSNVVSQTDSQYYNDDDDDDDDSSSPTSKSSSTVFDEDLSDEYEFASTDSRLKSNYQDEKLKYDKDKYMRELMSFRKDEL